MTGHWQPIIPSSENHFLLHHKTLSMNLERILCKCWSYDISRAEEPNIKLQAENCARLSWNLWWTLIMFRILPVGSLLFAKGEANLNNVNSHSKFQWLSVRRSDTRWDTESILKGRNLIRGFQPLSIWDDDWYHYNSKLGVLNVF